MAPAGLQPAARTTVEGWIEPLRPGTPRLYTIRPWRFQNEQGSAAGRAAVRISPPDSLRFDYRAPFGRSGAAVVVGDSALWVRPRAEFGALMSVAPLLWGALGMPPMAPEGRAVYALERNDLRAWRYVIAGDTLNWILRGGDAPQLVGEIRRGGRTIGVTRADLDPATGLVTAARIDFPQDVSRFSLTVQDVDTLATLDATIWRQP